MCFLYKLDPAAKPVPSHVVYGESRKGGPGNGTSTDSAISITDVNSLIRTVLSLSKY